MRAWRAKVNLWSVSFRVLEVEMLEWMTCMCVCLYFPSSVFFVACFRVLIGMLRHAWYQHSSLPVTRKQLTTSSSGTCSPWFSHAPTTAALCRQSLLCPDTHHLGQDQFGSAYTWDWPPQSPSELESFSLVTHIKPRLCFCCRFLALTSLRRQCFVWRPRNDSTHLTWSTRLPSLHSATTLQSLRVDTQTEPAGNHSDMRGAAREGRGSVSPQGW